MIINFGSKPPDYIQNGLNIYIKRIKAYFPIEVKEHNLRSDDDEEKILDKMKEKNCQVVLLSEDGELMDSKCFAQKIQYWFNSGKKNLIFVVGNAYGFSEKIKKNYPLLSLSLLTFNQHLALLILIEQIYRALTILHHHPYHH
ncbi:MAG: 23S rRNA (pseudouridine(1915)-N(3))-methyltransferase RlmH [Bacteroidales bacterium]|nr:23S rRNA (pseudouridine(1915)-N(3))-methyltransferase RlmH [Bacteroidales bacterium]